MSIDAEFIFTSENVLGKKEQFGAKAVNLAELKRIGIPIPESYFISTQLHQFYQQTGELPLELVSTLTQLRELLGGAVAIRSSATIEDGSHLSMAGVFDSFYIQSEEPAENLIEKTGKIYAKSESREVTDLLAIHGIAGTEVQMGLVLQRLIKPKFSGVIYTNAATNQTIVQYINNYGDVLVDGHKKGSTMVIDTSSSMITSSVLIEEDSLTAPELTVLLNYANTIHTHYGQNQDIEFVIEEGSNKVYIVQARPLTVELGVFETELTSADLLTKTKSIVLRIIAAEKELGTIEAAFSDSNFSELLPFPMEADFAIFAYIFTGLDSLPGAIQLGRRQMGYEVGDETIGFMHYIGGKPYLSIARDAGTFYAGFPKTREEYYSTLVNSYIQSIVADPEKGIYPEMGLYLQDPTEADLIQRYTNKGSEYYQSYLRFSSNLGLIASEHLLTFESRLTDLESFYANQAQFNTTTASKEEVLDFITDNLEYLRLNACVDFVKAARLGFYYTQRLMVELSRKYGYSEEKVAETIAILSQGLEGSKTTQVNLDIAQAETEEEALALASRLIGHYSNGEALEIRHERYSSDPQSILKYVRGIRNSGDYASKFISQKEKQLEFQAKLLGSLPSEERENLENLIANARKYMALRETSKYYFTKGYAEIRRGIIELALRTATNQQDIFHLYPSEFRDFLLNPDSYGHVLKSRIQEYQLYPTIAIPRVFTTDDVANFDLVGEAIDFTQAKGKFIAHGEDIESGIIINLDEFAPGDNTLTELLERYRLAGIPIILAAKQVNLTHDPLIISSAGLILENAGLVSHGAQRSRELGIGAISGIKISKLKTGMRVSFSPQERLVKLITE